MSTSVNTWILGAGSDYTFAVAEVEMVEYLPEPIAMDVPLSPHYCSAVIPWRERLLPLMHYQRLFEPTASHEQRHIGVLAYQLQPGEPLRHLAIALSAPPYRIAVTDDLSEDLPERYADPIYRPLVRAVFLHNDAAVPVLDVAYLASTLLRDSMLERMFVAHAAE